ncbi:Nucleoporin [Lachnellula hyalina]|uniref:Nucleoporin n=1 Tax=Lachnellula hyalina TaxID=1316788 RepID=A0A8H8U1X4_9HELO|nr:Nucleoporin [Lachnellula hyalina]TVY30524.1 Nucleoporin [Lachnellula hyalina]
MAPVKRVRPYKDFLTPAMHRRFAMATSTLFGLCYLESILIGEKNSLIWSWFPFGRAGIRTGLLFIPAFVIFILRVAQLHVGLRTSNSAWQTFKRYSLNFNVVQTIGFYVFSAYMFSEIYLWSASNDADMSRIKVIPKTDRLMLNEKPIYIACYLFILGFVQAGFHLFYDYDRIDMPVTKTKANIVVPPAVQLRTKLPAMISTSIQRALGVAIFSPFLYYVNWGIYPYSIRRFAWSLNRAWAKLFWNLPKSSMLPSIHPFHISVLMRTVTSGFLLLMLWEVGNAAFSAYVAQEPLKNERPITYESRDPNGSLLTGLKGNKLQTKAFAFWELVYIAQRFEGRRKNVFEDIDRVGGSAWSQILAVCLETIQGMELRITEYQNPPRVAADAKAKALAPDPAPLLPRISAPLKDGLNAPGDIFSASPAGKTESQRAVEVVGRFAKRHGQSPPKSISPRSKQLLIKAESAVLTPEQQEALSKQGVGGLIKTWFLVILKSSLGWPFRQEYRRRIATVVLGTPYGDVGIIVDAIDALTRLAVCSLAEDNYGNVQKDVKMIIQTFTRAVIVLEGFKPTIGVHWTDVEPKQESPEVDTILEALKGGLEELIDAFGDYSQDLRLSQSEMRQAREAATPKRRSQMAEVK